MSAGRLQHTVASGLIALASAGICWLSFTQEPSAAFLFPRLISVALVALSFWTFVKALRGLSQAGSGISGELLVNMLPGLVVMLVYIFWAAKALGFYSSTAIAVFILLSLYDPAPHDKVMSWLRRGAITGVFVLVMYGLFAMLLKVYTPAGVIG